MGAKKKTKIEEKIAEAPQQISLFNKYQADLNALVKRGQDLEWAMQYRCAPDDFRKQVEGAFKGDKAKVKEFFAKLPAFNTEYEAWYSEAQSLIKQVLPNRLEDFIRLHEKPKNRKSIEYGNYVMEDFLQNLRVTYGGETKVDSSAALTQFAQQLNIVKAISQRFKSSLFDIRQLVQADLLDSELDAARELLKNKFARAAGAVAGVVLEAHLAQVVQNHNLTVSKSNPNISDLNDLLKNSDVIDTPQWRKIQHLGDLRNLCDHKKEKDPTADNVTELIDGVEAITKTLF